MARRPEAARGVDRNPKDRIGARKLSFAAIPVPPLAEVAVVMMDGAAKYGRHNWRAAEVRASIYYDAALRHLVRWFEGEDVDPDSGLPHLAHAGACVMIVRDAALRGALIDDRPPPSPGFLEALQPMVDAIRARHPDPVPPVTAAALSEGLDGAPVAARAGALVRLKDGALGIADLRQIADAAPRARRRRLRQAPARGPDGSAA